MISPQHIESLLKINGLEKTAPDEEIRSVLISARFKEDEVETALMVLRENTETKQTKVDGLHKVFRSDQVLNSSEISNLLGIDVTVKNIANVSVKKQRVTLFQTALFWLVSFSLAAVSVLFYMYAHQMGLFHPDINVAILNAH